MSLPEISRRCLACGAAVRAGARFCPQCGQKMDAEPAADGDAGAWRAAAAAEEPPAAADVPAAPETREAEAAQEWAPPTKEFEAFVQPQVFALPRAESGAAESHADSVTPPLAEPDPGVAGAAVPGEVVADSGAAEEAGARGRVARAREAGRARVGRMRDEAIVVLEETPDDSGLRFVIAAAALFIVFVFLLVLSTTVLR
ncbi:MAG TPA: zinc ribbon domain-containing protein [Pyrinomonadaceae bacterium]|jgi:hypothetical protein